jgi:hypothetical protein
MLMLWKVSYTNNPIYTIDKTILYITLYIIIIILINLFIIKMIDIYLIHF